ncbi:MAG: hypothetical protein ACXWUR_10385, partial [Allosphingosinicella sp.]
MTSLALRHTRTAAPVVTELFDRQRTLAGYGIALILLALGAVVLQALDPRTLASGASIWVKPAKFLSSVGIMAVTAAWLFGYVRPDRRGSRLMRATVGLLLLAGTFELVWIVWQGAHGRESHFNFDTLLFAGMYQLMGIFAVLLVATTLPLAWEIRTPAGAGPARRFRRGGGDRPRPHLPAGRGLRRRDRCQWRSRRRGGGRRGAGVRLESVGRRPAHCPLRRYPRRAGAPDPRRSGRRLRGPDTLGAADGRRTVDRGRGVGA